MKKDIFKGEVISIVTTIALWGICILTGAMYFLTNYFLYFFFNQSGKLDVDVVSC